MNQTSDIDRIKKTISDLLNLADNDAAFDQEADNALRFARKLMMRHGIEQCDLEEKRDAHSVEAAADVEYGLKHCYSEANSLSQWEQTLLTTICHLIGTLRWYYDSKRVKKTRAGTVAFDDDGKQQRGARITFYGPAEDGETALDLFDEWRQVVIAMARLKYGGVFRGEGRSYCEGFVRELWQKVRKIGDEEYKASRSLDGPAAERSNALMVINSTAIQLAKKAKGKEWLEKEKGVKLRAGSGRTFGKHHGNAYAEGKTDGKKANLSHARRKRLG